MSWFLEIILYRENVSYLDLMDWHTLYMCYEFTFQEDQVTPVTQQSSSQTTFNGCVTPKQPFKGLLPSMASTPHNKGIVYGIYDQCNSD